MSESLRSPESRARARYLKYVFPHLKLASTELEQGVIQDTPRRKSKNTSFETQKQSKLQTVSLRRSIWPRASLPWPPRNSSRRSRTTSPCATRRTTPPSSPKCTSRGGSPRRPSRQAVRSFLIRSRPELRSASSAAARERTSSGPSQRNGSARGSCCLLSFLKEDLFALLRPCGDNCRVRGASAALEVGLWHPNPLLMHDLIRD